MDYHPHANLSPARNASGIGDILGTVWSLYVMNAALFVAVGAVILLPYTVLVVILAAVIVGSDQMIIDKLATFLFEHGQLSSDPVSVYYGLVAVGLALAVVMFLLVVEPVATAALTVAIADRHAGHHAPMRLVYRRVLPRLGLLARSMVWAALRLLPAILFCAVVVGIPLLCYFLVAWFFVVPVVMLGRGRGSATRRSRFLVRGAWRATCGFIVTISLLTGIATVALIAIVAGILTVIPGLGDPQVQASILVVLAIVIRALVLPIQTGATTLYYYSLEARETRSGGG